MKYFLLHFIVGEGGCLLCFPKIMTSWIWLVSQIYAKQNKNKNSQINISSIKIVYNVYLC